MPEDFAVIKFEKPGEDDPNQLWPKLRCPGKGMARIWPAGCQNCNDYWAAYEDEFGNPMGSLYRLTKGAPRVVATRCRHPKAFREPLPKCRWCGSEPRIGTRDPEELYFCSNEKCKMSRVSLTRDEWNLMGECLV